MNAHASASAGSSRSSRSNFGRSSNHPASIVKQIMTAYRVGYKDPQGCQHAPLKDRIFSGDPAIDTDCKVWLNADAYKQCDSWETFCSRYQISEATNTMEKLLTAVVKHYRQFANADGVCHRRIMREYHQGGVSVKPRLQVYQFPPWKNLDRSRSVNGTARHRLDIGDWTMALGDSDNFCRTFNIDPDRTNETEILQILGDRASAQGKNITQMVKDLSSPSQLAVGPELVSQPFRQGTRALLEDWESIKGQLGPVKAGEKRTTQQRRNLIAYIEQNGLERLFERLPGLRDQPTFENVDRLTRKGDPWYVKRHLSDGQKEKSRIRQRAIRAASRGGNPGQNDGASAA